jgi:hypothetical protein
MLLEHDMSVMLHLRAARVWQHRERIEREAATLFTHLAEELDIAGYTALARRAAQAAEDERRHAGRCRALVLALGGTPANDEPMRLVELGPRELPRRDRMLYAAVAIGCVTESLSCSLLLALREAATHAQVRATVDEVLADEIEHSRIGWSVLAAESARRDVRWLRNYLPAMAQAAYDEDVRPMVGDDELAGLGVLPRGQVSTIVSETWMTVIGRGLERHGILSASAA